MLIAEKYFGMNTFELLQHNFWFNASTNHEARLRPRSSQSHPLHFETIPSSPSSPPSQSPPPTTTPNSASTWLNQPPPFLQPRLRVHCRRSSTDHLHKAQTLHLWHYYALP